MPRLVVTLDGDLDEAEGAVILSEDEQLLDAVAWGGHGGTVSLVVGDFVAGDDRGRLNHRAATRGRPAAQAD